MAPFLRFILYLVCLLLCLNLDLPDSALYHEVMKAFVFDPLWNELVDDTMRGKLSGAGVEIVLTTDIKPLAETKEIFEGDEDRLLCLNPDYVSWKLRNEDYETIPHLKGIFIASTGYEWVEHESADKLGIPICQIVDFSTQSVAEWAVMMMLALARQTPRLIKDGFPLDYDKDFMKYRGIELKGKTAGIIGLGNIGSAIADRCKGLGMEVVYWSRSSTSDAYTKVSLEELMATADVIFPIMAKSPETLSLMSDDLIRTVKSSAIFVDMAHGLLNQKLVLEMISDHRLFGYGFEGEPGSFNNFEGNVWAAPAYAWATYESMHNSQTRFVDNIVSAAKGQFPYRVN